LTHFGSDPLVKIRDSQWRERLTDKGWDFVFMVSPEMQTDEQDLYVQWRVQENKASYHRFNLWAFNIASFTNITPEDMSSLNGLSVETIGGAKDIDLWGLGNFHYEYASFDKQLKVKLGHLFTNMNYSSNKYMEDDRKTFMNSVLNSPVGIQWTSKNRWEFWVA